MPEERHTPKLPRLLRQLSRGGLTPKHSPRLWWLSAGVLAVAIMARLGTLSWVFELFSHLAVHQILVATLLIAVSVWRKARFAGALAGIALMLNLWVVLPLYWGPSLPSGATDKTAVTVNELRVCTFNVLGDNPTPNAPITYLENAPCDVVVLIEVRPLFAKSLDALRDTYPIVEMEPRPDNFGIAIASRIQGTRAQFLRSPDGDTALIEAEVPVGNTTWRVLGVHPPPPVSGQLASERNAALAMIAQWARSNPGPSVVAGDLNLTPFSPYFGRLLSGGGLHNSMDGFGVTTSWPNGIGVLGPVLRIPIDHVLHTGSVVTVERVVGPALGSDHQPVVTLLRDTMPP